MSVNNDSSTQQNNLNSLSSTPFVYPQIKPGTDWENTIFVNNAIVKTVAPDVIAVSNVVTKSETII